MAPLVNRCLHRSEFERAKSRERYVGVIKAFSVCRRLGGRMKGRGRELTCDTYDFEYITVQNIDVGRLLKYSRSHSGASIMPDTFQSLGEREVLKRRCDSGTFLSPSLSLSVSPLSWEKCMNRVRH